MTVSKFRGPYWFLNNFSPSAPWPTVEHHYQAAKGAGSDSYRARILSAQDAATAKFLGRQCELPDNWDTIKVDVMRKLLRIKFASGSVLATSLLATGDEELAEGNDWHDNFWGQCHCPRCAGQGQNWLGRLLMERREELQQEENIHE